MIIILSYYLTSRINHNCFGEHQTLGTRIAYIESPLQHTIRYLERTKIVLMRKMISKPSLSLDSSLVQVYHIYRQEALCSFNNENVYLLHYYHHYHDAQDDLALEIYPKIFVGSIHSAFNLVRLTVCTPRVGLPNVILSV